MKLNRNEVKKVNDAIKELLEKNMPVGCDVKIHVPTYSTDSQDIESARLSVIIRPREQETIPPNFILAADKLGVSAEKLFHAKFNFKTDYTVVGVKKTGKFVIRNSDGKNFQVKPEFIIKHVFGKSLTKKPATKKTVDDKAKQVVKNIVNEKLKKPARTAKSKPEKNEVVNLNNQLKEKKLWIKGCQFLSRAEKEKLLNAKTKKSRNAIYNIVKAKLEKVYGKK